jgi:GT2 family glycosyltransferase/glycosyltransferase involved in cell wall biosynthesis
VRPPVDVIVPVYGAAAALSRCLASLRATLRADHRLLVSLDGPQDAETEAVLTRHLDGFPAPFQVLRAARRAGFPAAVNRALGLGARHADVVLLNSDTITPQGWLTGLAEAAHSSPQVASATPFSNAATLASLPRWLENNLLPAGYDVESFAQLVRRASASRWPEIPFGVGFCLYLRRTALDAVGAFDERFGLGYGEEVEWCLRASRLGFVHLLDDASFVFHEGQASFGLSTEPRVRRAERGLRRRYPEYWRDLGRFLREDPLRPCRERVLDALRTAGRRTVSSPRTSVVPLDKILHVVHGWPPWARAGTELYAAWLARWQAERRAVLVYARSAFPARRDGQATEYLDQGEVRVRLINQRFTSRDPLRRNGIRWPEMERDFTRLLAAERPGLVHIHHLAGHSSALPAVARRLGIPVVHQVQDWWTGCARANLLDAERRLCAGPTASRCDRCLPLTSRPPRRLWNAALLGLRNARLRRALRQADARICGSRALADSFRALGWLTADEAIDILEYGVPAVTMAPRAARREGAADRPLACGFIGSLLPHKGAHVALAAWRRLPPGQARLTVWGNAAASPAYFEELTGLATDEVRFAPPFDDGEQGAIFAGLDLLIVPSLGLESFGLVAREAMAHGVPVLAADRGALPEMFRGDRPFGASFDPERPEDLADWIRRLAEHRTQLDDWRANLPRVVGVEEHAEAVERVYQRVIERRRSGA